MIPVDTLDSVALRSAFSRIFNTKGFTYMAYALSGLALAIAALESYSVISNSDVLPDLTGPVLAVIIVCAAFGYGFATRNRIAETLCFNNIIMQIGTISIKEIRKKGLKQAYPGVDIT